MIIVGYSKLSQCAVAVATADLREVRLEPEELSLLHWLAWIALVVISVGGGRRIRSIWTDKQIHSQFRSRLEKHWPLGPVFGRAVVRTIPLALVTVSSAALLIGALLLPSVINLGAAAERTLGWTIAVLIGLMLVSIVLAWSVTLFNRPRFVVPPWTREQRGVLGESWVWLRRRSSRSR